MSQIRALFVKFWQKVSARAGRYFTPKEYRAALMFLGLGLAAFGVREARMYFGHSPGIISDSAARAIRHTNDSVFIALSKKASVHDSLNFWMESATVSAGGSRSKKNLKLSRDGISLNYSSLDSLLLLPGVGAVTAKRIVAYRNERGRFRSLDELMNVEGIGEKKFKTIEPFLRLD